MPQEKGNLSINSENFLPIIKKWLYTDQDIFIRELVSNACDAVTKHKKLAAMGEVEESDGEYSVQVTLDLPQKRIIIRDNGIGMTAEEIKKYINQIAFSGVNDFLAKFEEKENPNQDIIGHFGLGFYSAFMVADRVVIDSLSFQKDAVAARWTCDGGITFEMEDGVREERGTDIILSIGEEGKAFLDEDVLREALDKYCFFMPVPITYTVIPKMVVEKKQKPQDDQEAESGQEAQEVTDKPMEESVDEPAQEMPPEERPGTIVNNPNPLWLKNAKDCTEEEYKEFYQIVFRDMKTPLFWIHLNMDYPFRLKGILYFPKINQHSEPAEGEIKLYSNQVYIADNVKEVVPEFLLLLKGVIDCPDLPLNVSRSALQNDGYVEKMSQYITKKVADKLNELFKTNRTEFEKTFDDISVFIKYGCLKETKLYDKIKDSMLYHTTDGVQRTLPEYLEKNKTFDETHVIYVSDEKQQVQYIKLLQEQGMEAILLTEQIDRPFVNLLEYKAEGKLMLERVDSHISNHLKKEEKELAEEEKEEQTKQKETLEAFFQKSCGLEKLKIDLAELKNDGVSGVIVVDESSRRLMEMREAYQSQGQSFDMFGEVQVDETLVLNKNNPLIRTLQKLQAEGKEEEATLICQQIYDLAYMGYQKLEPEQMADFIKRSNQILEKLMTNLA